MNIDALEQQFVETRQGTFRARNGKGRQPGGAFCNKKLCLVATDKFFLVQLLFELADDPQCYYVKYAAEPRDGMYLGRCFMLDEESVGRLWLAYKPHPKVLCSIQDDDFTARFRGQRQGD